jgi:hypothetical protein
VTEAEWVEDMAEHLRADLGKRDQRLSVRTKLRLAYGYEIVGYDEQPMAQSIEFETDLAILETGPGESWRPRVVVEAKLGRVSTHDAITYSQKAGHHRAVHPYLRYGVMLGRRRQYPLPGRLYRHGAQFDFMISFVDSVPTKQELGTFCELVRDEVAAARLLEKLLYESRKAGRDRYTFLQRKLEVR